LQFTLARNGTVRPLELCQAVGVVMVRQSSPRHDTKREPAMNLTDSPVADGADHHPRATMRLPAFFDDVPRLTVRDPMAELLGCAAGGIFEYGYADAVRLTGHSCPTVASAYWLTVLALRALYADELPVRGGIEVQFRDSARSGSVGVVATVVQMLTGAAGSSGFKGLGGSFSRAGLLRIAPDLPMSLRYRRLDTGAAVDAASDVSLPPASPMLHDLGGRSTRQHLDAAAMAELGRLWQARVRMLLIDLRDDPAVFTIRPAKHKARLPACRPQRLRDLSPAID
jgi:hypothetical protein